ncbi:type IX secretion system plug protein [Parapedobacter tibetensis]|uniref:type IX secretion system plug protein n=1 Tax=Parapedobacter tibetensis TaxID=2972951 RepID=UPI00214DAB02|nr:type IX secretion system plug protein domain-containing protein [Parapedobacter tibetensis]
MKKILILCLLSSICLGLMAQKQKKKRVARERSPQQELVYDNINYLPAIKTVQLHPAAHENTLPIIELHGDGQLTLEFDDLRGDVRNYYFSIEHYDPNWKPSRLSPLEFAIGFNEDRITTYKTSVNTLQPYTHYRVNFPTANVGPKLAGNYLLKVYEDADKSRLIISRRFYVLAPLMSVSPQLIPSFDVSKRNKNQKLNLKVNTGGLTVNNPYEDVKILVMQNQRPDIQQWLTTPLFVNNQELTYNDNKTLDFGGGNEFRYMDLRSLRLASEHVANIAVDSSVRVDLVPDKNYSGASYASVFDENGLFFIRNQDKADATTESDYVWVTFTLEDDTMTGGSVHVVGGFNNYHCDESNKMVYDANQGKWQATILLKQGLYDYEYVYVSPSGGSNPTFSSGNHFETNNTYQILVYNRRQGTTWDELVGYAEIDTENR